MLFQAKGQYKNILTWPPMDIHSFGPNALNRLLRFEPKKNVNGQQ